MSLTFSSEVKYNYKEVTENDPKIILDTEAEITIFYSNYENTNFTLWEYVLDSCLEVKCSIELNIHISLNHLIGYRLDETWLYHEFLLKRLNKYKIKYLEIDTVLCFGLNEYLNGRFLVEHPELEELCITKNEYFYLTNYCLPKLKVLRLSDVNLDILRIKELVNLKVLSLDHFSMSEFLIDIDELCNFVKNGKLEELHISRNHLLTYDIQLRMIDELSNLKCLILPGYSNFHHRDDESYKKFYENVMQKLMYQHLNLHLLLEDETRFTLPPQITNNRTRLLLKEKSEDFKLKINILKNFRIKLPIELYRLIYEVFFPSNLEYKLIGNSDGSFLVEDTKGHLHYKPIFIRCPPIMTLDMRLIF